MMPGGERQLDGSGDCRISTKQCVTCATRSQTVRLKHCRCFEERLVLPVNSMDTMPSTFVSCVTETERASPFFEEPAAAKARTFW